MENRRFYLSTISPDAPETARRYGLGLEIAEYCTAYNMDERFPETDAAVREKLGGISRRTLHAPFNELFPCAIDPLARKLAAYRYAQALELAARYGAGKVILHGGFSPKLYYPCWYVEQSVIFWREFLKTHPGKYEICLENVMEEEPETLLSIVSQVDAPRLRLCLDVGHVNHYSRHPALEWMECWGGWLSHLHLHNNDGSADSHGSLQHGSLPMADIIRRIGGSMTATLELIEIGNDIHWLEEAGLLDE